MAISIVALPVNRSPPRCRTRRRGRSRTPRLIPPSSVAMNPSACDASMTTLPRRARAPRRVDRAATASGRSAERSGKRSANRCSSSRLPPAWPRRIIGEPSARSALHAERRDERGVGARRLDAQPVGGCSSSSIPPSKRADEVTVADHGPASGVLTSRSFWAGTRIRIDSAGIAPGTTASRNMKASSTAGCPGRHDQQRLGVGRIDQPLDAAEQLRPIEARRAEAVQVRRGAAAGSDRSGRAGRGAPAAGGAGAARGRPGSAGTGTSSNSPASSVRP